MLPAANGQVEVWIRKSALIDSGKRPALRVLCFCAQGFQAQSKGWDVLDLADDVPMEFWTMNYPGYGSTTGPSKLSLIGPCALANFDAMRKIDNTPIVASGYSLGTVPALYVSARRDVNGVMIYNPPLLRDMFLRQGWWNLWAIAWPMSLAVPDDLNSAANAAATRAPGVLISSTLDNVAPFTFQQRIINEYGGPKNTLIFQAGHSDPFTAQQSQHVKDALHWLVQRLR